MTLGGVYC